MPRPRALLALLAVAVLGSACNPVIKIGMGGGARYDKKVAEDKTEVERKISEMSSVDDVDSALMEARDEPLLFLAASEWMYDRKDYQRSADLAGRALDLASRLPAAEGYRAGKMAKMFNFQMQALAGLGQLDDAQKAADECLEYPELLNCLPPAATIAARRKDGDGVVQHLGALWKASPGFSINSVVYLAAREIPSHRAAIRDLVRDAYKPRWDDESAWRYRQFMLAELDLAVGDTDAAREQLTLASDAKVAGAQFNQSTLSPSEQTIAPQVQIVYWGSGPHAAGVRACDIVTSVAGRPTPNLFDFRVEYERLRRDLKAGQVVPMTLQRDGEQVELSFVWGDHPGAKQVPAGGKVEPGFDVCGRLIQVGSELM